MRGVGLEMEEMIKLFLIIIIGLVVTILIVGASGGIKQMIDDFCAKNPKICGGPSQPDKNMASASFDALVLAHNCVLDPSTCLCIKPAQASCTINADNLQQTSGSSGGLFGIPTGGKMIGGGISGLQTIKPITTSKEVKVECTSGYAKEESVSLQGGPTLCEEKCRSYGSKCKSWDYQTYQTGEDIRMIDNSCVLQIEALTCTVTNFNVPDNFKGITGTAREYISGFGDPNFLVYFQKFPQGEDRSWTSMSAWYEGVGAVMMMTMCAGSLAKPVSKLVNIFRPSTSAETLAGIRTMLQKDSTYIESVLRRSTVPGSFRQVKLDPASEMYLKIYKVPGTTPIEYIPPKVSSSMVLDTLKADSVAWLKANWKPEMQKAMAYAGTYAAVDAEAAYALSRIDSEAGKFVYDNPRSLVLGTALAKQQPTQLKTIEYDNTGGAIPKLGKPIILDKQTPVSLTLASPCRADLAVKDVNLMCGYYSYDQLTGNVQCLNPEIISPASTQLKCGDFAAFKQGSGLFTTDYKVNEKFFNSLQGMMNDKTVSSYSGHEIQRLRMPSATTAFLQNIQRNACAGVSSSLVCYKADLYEGGSKRIEGLQIVCAIDYAALVSGIANPNRAKYVNMLGNLFKTNSNEGYSDFCMVYNDPANTAISDAFAQYKKDAGIQGANSLEAGEIIWVKDRPYSAEWTWVDGYATGAGDEYYDNGKEKYYPAIFGMAIFSGDPGRSSLAYFKDGSLGINQISGSVDSRWKEFALFANQITDNWVPSTAKAFVFDDQDGNGALDAVSYWNCWTSGVATTVDAKKYPSTTDNPNFCYAVDPWYNGAATTTAVFAMDALAKRVPHPATWIASTAANCLLGIVQVVGKDNWPEGGVGG